MIQGTHVQGVRRSGPASLLLGIEVLAVVDVVADGDAGGRVAHVVTVDESAAACPTCAHGSRRP